MTKLVKECALGKLLVPSFSSVLFTGEAVNCQKRSRPLRHQVSYTSPLLLQVWPQWDRYVD